jgi:hypothetical protein
MADRREPIRATEEASGYPGDRLRAAPIAAETAKMLMKPILLLLPLLGAATAYSAA